MEDIDDSKNSVVGQRQFGRYVAEIKNLQENGKLDPNLVLTKLGDMMQKMAHDSGAFEKMKESSSFKQGQFQEQLSQTATEIMQSGLDEKLGDLFGALTELAVVLGNVATSLQYIVGLVKEGISWFNEFAGSNTLLSSIMLVLLFRFKGLSKGRGACRSWVCEGRSGI